MQTLDPNEARRAALSALMDGDDAGADSACRAWGGDALARADWHAYHVIGDLLRSDEHRADAAHDARFLARVRERLAGEPAVLASAIRPKATARRVSAWMAPAAVAAGFVAVAGVLVVTRVASPDGGADRTALAADTRSAPQAGAASVPALDNAALIRSAELDRYLAAHRQFANASTLIAPGSVMRSAATAAPER